MASDDLHIPQIAIVGVPDDNGPSSSSSAVPSPSPPLDSSRLPPSPSITNNCASARNSLDPLGSPTHNSDNTSLPLPPSPTLSALSSGSVNSTILRDPEEHNGTSSLYLVQPPHGHRRKSSTGTVSSIGSGSTTEQDANDNSSFRLSPMRSAQCDVTSPLPSSTYTHLDGASDVCSRPSSVTSFFNETVHRVRQPSPSPCRETGTGSDTTPNDGQKGDNADAKRKGAELARPAMLDLKQEADLDVHPFAFSPLELASLVDSKSLETLESMGGVDAQLRGLGTHPIHGLSTESGSPPAHLAPLDPTLRIFTVSHATDKDPPQPDIMTASPAGEPQGTARRGDDVLAESQSSKEVYRTSIEDRQRIFDHNVLSRRPSKSLLQLIWLELKDKVLVSSN
jgi:Ca2+-transporting ATPase